MSKEHARISRRFPRDIIQHGDKRIPAAKIECSKCGSVAYHPDTGLNDDVYFAKKGWSVGRGPAADTCPECQKRKPEMKVVKMEQPQAPKVEPPREMGREDRRIITDKLDEVYDDKAGSYKAPWTDAAVGRDLGVPRAWVSEVREQFFGPEGGNPEFDAFIEQAAPIIAEMKNMANSLRVQSERFKELEPRISELERMGRRIERELGR